MGFAQDFSGCKQIHCTVLTGVELTICYGLIGENGLLRRMRMIGVGHRRRWHTLIDKDELSTTGVHIST